MKEETDVAEHVLTPQIIAKMFLAGAKNLESQKEHINELNVFPVPDGDTGTNMTLTIMSAAKDVYSLEDPDMATLCKSISSGSLRGARGNSGVILSQLFRGFTKVVKGYDEVDVAVVSAACDRAVESAYKAVMQPKEGTILTVAKGIAEKVNEVFASGEQDFDVLFREVIAHAKAVLDQTPEMLPVLKEAGVVDSGGAGLIAVLEGFYDGYLGKGIEFTMDEETSQAAGEVRLLHAEEPQKQEFRYLYQTTLSLLLDKTFHLQSEQEVRKFLNGVGDGVTLSVEDGIVNVGVNTNDPGLVLQKAIKYGALVDVKVVNRSLPVNDDAKSDTAAVHEEVRELPKKAVGFVAVAAGAGFGEIFRNLGADVVIEGGQTMNPSTDDMLQAIAQINADTIYILPNNKNIILAANQARDMTKDKTIVVIPSKTVPQGISAMIANIPDAPAEDNTAAMEEAITAVKSGQLTYAVRDTSIDGVEIHQDDYMGIGDSGILSNGRDLAEVMETMIGKMVDDSSEIVSVYYGQDVKQEDAEALTERLSAKYPAVEFDLQNGGQPVYYYFVSVE